MLNKRKKLKRKKKKRKMNNLNKLNKKIMLHPIKKILKMKK